MASLFLDMVERVSFRLMRCARIIAIVKKQRALAKEEALFAANAPQPAKKLRVDVAQQSVFS